MSEINHISKAYFASELTLVKDVFSKHIAYEKYGDKAVQVINDYPTTSLISIIISSKKNFRNTIKEVYKLAKDNNIKVIAMQDLEEFTTNWFAES